jgi:hypothetical protein
MCFERAPTKQSLLERVRIKTALFPCFFGCTHGGFDSHSYLVLEREGEREGGREGGREREEKRKRRCTLALRRAVKEDGNASVVEAHSLEKPRQPR